MTIQVNLFNEKEQRAFKRLFNYLWIENYPEDHPANGFYSALGLEDYAHFFETCLQPGGAGRYGSHAGFNRGPLPPEPEDPGLTDQEVAIGGNYIGVEIISLQAFLAITLSFAEKVLEVATEQQITVRGIVDKEWTIDIQLAIRKIEAAVNALNE